MTTKVERKQRLLALADTIERVGQANQFNYDHWCAKYDRERSALPVEAGMFVRDLIDNPTGSMLVEGDCSTAGCVAGWGAVQALTENFKPAGYEEMTISQYAGEYLGLNGWEVDSVFMGGALIVAGFYDIEDDTDAIRDVATPVEVAKMLRMVAEGEVRL